MTSVEGVTCSTADWFSTSKYNSMLFVVAFASPTDAGKRRGEEARKSGEVWVGLFRSSEEVKGNGKGSLLSSFLFFNRPRTTLKRRQFKFKLKL